MSFFPHLGIYYVFNMLFNLLFLNLTYFYWWNCFIVIEIDLYWLKAGLPLKADFCYFYTVCHMWLPIGLFVLIVIETDILSMKGASVLWFRLWLLVFTCFRVDFTCSLVISNYLGYWVGIWEEGALRLVGRGSYREFTC